MASLGKIGGLVFGTMTVLKAGGCRSGYISCRPLPPGGGLSFKCMLVDGRLMGLDLMRGQGVCFNQQNLSQLGLFHRRGRALTPESTAATTLHVLQSQRRPHCACCVAFVYECLPCPPCKPVDRPT